MTQRGFLLLHVCKARDSTDEVYSPRTPEPSSIETQINRYDCQQE